MGKLNRDWTVGPHGPLERLEEGLVTVTGEIAMPLGRFPRRMTAVTLSEGRLAVWSPIPLREEGMAALEALGRIAFLIVPGPHHRLDIAAWHARYPDAAVLCPRGARGAVREVAPTCDVEDVMGAHDVRFSTVPGTRSQEGALEIRRAGHFTLVLNDVIANVRHPRGIGAQVMARLFGFGVSHPQVPRAVRRALVGSPQVLAEALEDWAVADLVRIVPSHGDIIDHDPAGALRRAARSLR